MKGTFHAHVSLKHTQFRLAAQDLKSMSKYRHFTHRPDCECNRLFTTSLTRSAVSRYLGLFFHDFEHTFHVSAHALVPFERVTMWRRLICVQPKWLGPFSLHQIRWRCPPDISPVTFDHDDLFELPPFGEASSLFSYPVTAMQDHCCNLAFPHGLPRTAAAVRGDRTLCSQSGHAT